MLESYLNLSSVINNDGNVTSEQKRKKRYFTFKFKKVIIKQGTVEERLWQDPKDVGPVE